MDYFHSLPPETRDRLVSQQKHLYKGINTDLINDIHDLLYTKRLQTDLDARLMTNCRLTDARQDASVGGFRLSFHHTEQNRSFNHHCHGLVLATGYRYQPPAFLEGIRERIGWDDQDRFDVKRNYSIDKNGGEIFVQNAELHTHGFVTPDLGMACYRNAWILRELTGREPYPIERRIAFQEFGVPEAAPRLQAELC